SDSRGGVHRRCVDGALRFRGRSGHARDQRALGNVCISICEPRCTMTVCEPAGFEALGVGGNTNFGSGTGASLGAGSTNCGTITTSSGSTPPPHGPQAKNGCRAKPSGARNRDRIPRCVETKRGDTKKCGETKMMPGAPEGPITIDPCP